MFDTSSLLSVLEGQSAALKSDYGLSQWISSMQTRSGPAFQPRQMSEETLSIGSTNSNAFKQMLKKGYLTKKELRDALHKTNGAMSADKISEIEEALSQWHKDVEKVLASQRERGGPRKRHGPASNLTDATNPGSSVHSYLPAAVADAEIAARDLAFAVYTFQYYENLPKNMENYGISTTKAGASAEPLVGDARSLWSGGNYSSPESGAPNYEEDTGADAGYISPTTVEYGLVDIAKEVVDIFPHIAFMVGPLLGAMFMLAGAIPIALAYEGVIGGKHPSNPTTLVSLTVGGFGSKVPSNDGGTVNVIDKNQEGSVPIWGDNAAFLGHYFGDEDGHLWPGASRLYEIPHLPKGAERGHPAYLAVYMQETDAICISQIKMQGPEGVGFSWLGDIGYECGYKWYYNDVIANAHQYKPRCTWLDGNLEQGPKGMGIHMPDFVGYTERLMQYKQRPDTLCSSPPRFQMYDSFSLDDELPIFDPPLEYLDDGRDKDLKKVVKPHYKSTSGKVPHFKKGKSKHPPTAQSFGMRPISNKDIDDRIKKESEKAQKAGANPKGGRRKREVKAAAYPHGTEIKLVSSDHEEHDIHELCDKEGSSRGPDFVSIHQGYFCDMSTKELWPICNDEMGVGSECFNYANKTLMGPASGVGKRDIHGREIPVKEYLTEYLWRVGEESKYKLIAF